MSEESTITEASAITDVSITATETATSADANATADVTGADDTAGLVQELVWYPNAAHDANSGARIEIADPRLRRLAVHHLVQHGHLGHGGHGAEIRAYTGQEDLDSNVVYIALNTVDMSGLMQRARLLQPIGFIAPADLPHLPAVTAAVLAGVSSRGPAADAIEAAASSLSARTLEALDLVAEGLTNTEIARRLNYSLSTVKRDVTELLEWFSVSSRRDLARAARDLGVIPSPFGGLADEGQYIPE